ncbi:MAG: hypothetical protein ACK5OX_14525 [Desertimonas sp.]
MTAPGRRGEAGRPRRIVGGLAALVALIALLAGVPALLVAGVGNPWPGADRFQMADTGSIVLGGVAVLAWLVWARFAAAVAVEAVVQGRERGVERRRSPGRAVPPSPPTRNTAGIGLVAARLVAAVLVLIPLGARSMPAAAMPLVRSSTPTAVIVDAAPPESSGRFDPPIAGTARQAAPTTVGLVRVTQGDTLRGLARHHLGDAERWREIFDLNRDRPQPGGARLTSPSALRSGWSLELPGGGAPPTVVGGDEPGVPEPPAYAAATTVTVIDGDTLWDLTGTRLESVGLPRTDAAIVGHLDEVIAANRDVVEDPDLIYPGEQIVLPALGTPPPTLTPSEEARPAVADSPSAEPSDLPPPPPPPPPAVPATDRDRAREATATTEVAPAVTVERPPASDRAESPPTTAPGDETETSESLVPAVPDVGDADRAGRGPSPIGLGEAALLSGGVVALLAARRQRRLRAAEPRARLPEPPPEQVTTERRLRAVDARERLVRVDLAVRAAAASLIDVEAQPVIVRVGGDGAVELILTADASLPPPWVASPGRWVLPGAVPIEALAEAARRVGAPCMALSQLGVDDDEREVLVDFEALGALTVHGPETQVEAVIRGVAATLASSIFAEPANLVGVGVDEFVFLDHALARHVDDVEAAMELAATLVGSTGSRPQSTFVLRARHTSGETWEPSVVVVGTDHAHEVSPELLESVTRRRGGIALIAGGDVPEGPWSLIADRDGWRLEPLGIRLTPVGLSVEDLAAVYELLHHAAAPLVADPTVPDPTVPEPIGADATDGASDPPWSLLVRLLGDVDVVDRHDRPVAFDRSKTLELVAWLTQHREQPTRRGARTALWDLDVRDATFANVVSEARRALARHVPPPEGEEWLARTLTESLPLHDLVIADVDLLRARLLEARALDGAAAIEILRPAVALIRGAPFSGTGYLWPDPEGITSNLVLVAISAATELAQHYLAAGDVDGVFWATGQGLRVLPGQEELIALRMRAHHHAGDLAGVRSEWESYERSLDGDTWGDGEPAPKLVDLRRELMRPTSSPGVSG